MKEQEKRLAAVLIALLPVSAFAAPVLNPANSHYYEVIPAPGISWDAAKLAAEMMEYNGVKGHLATITSSDEDGFVDTLRDSEVGVGGVLGSLGQTWIGGFQQAGSVEPGEGWTWVNGEGAIPGVDCDPTAGCPDNYADWATGEPNNAGPGENGLTLGRYGLGGGWNDEGAAPDSIGGYIVEYEFNNTVSAGDCLEGLDGEAPGFGCNPIGVAQVQLDNDSEIPAGATITHELLPPPAGSECPGAPLLHRDIRVDQTTGMVMARERLDVFGDGSLVLDDQTYGNKCFAVVYSNANFSLIGTLLDGSAATALVTQIPEALPGIVEPLSCYDGTTTPDMQFGAQATYQPNEKSRMFEGTAAAMTDRCNSPSRKSTAEFSYYVLNTREDCGIDISVSGEGAVFECFQQYAVDKFLALEQELINAQPFLVSPDYSELNKRLNRARSMIKNGLWEKAIPRIVDLCDAVEAATWNVGPGDINRPGYVVMRCRNLTFRALQLEIAQSQLP